jgi:hypothetical protein
MKKEKTGERSGSKEFLSHLKATPKLSPDVSPLFSLIESSDYVPSHKRRQEDIPSSGL